MVGARPDPRCSENLRDFGPQTRLELGASVGGDDVRNAELCDPTADEVAGDRLGVHGGQGNRRRPPCEAVHDGQQVRVACRGWQRSNQVDMDVLEAGARRLEGAHGWLGVALNLCALAVGAGANVVPYVDANLGPDEPCCQ